MSEESNLPAWATGVADSYFEKGAQLCTRDGRKIGNAVTVDGPESDRTTLIVTDHGNTLRLTLGELGELFHVPRYRMELTTHAGYIASQAGAAQGADKTWAAYVAGIINTYLESNPAKDVRESAIAGIIERRMVFASRPAAAAPNAWKATAEAWEARALAAEAAAPALGVADALDRDILKAALTAFSQDPRRNMKARERAAALARWPGAISAAPTLTVGGRYNWRGQPERLAYMGPARYPGDRRTWHQFEKVEEPGIVWCEVLDSDLPLFEVTGTSQENQQ